MTHTRDRWDDNRLDRLASTVEAIAERTNDNTAAIGLLGERTEIIATAVERLADVQLQTLRRIDEMQSEVRGLQTENRRIWEILQRRNGEDT